jgi:glycosyltransferase involved in cell wall biosynthesis
MSGSEAISVIVPTTASAARAATLRRALASLAAQQGARAIPIVVANGPRRDAAVMAELGADTSIRLIERDAGNLPLALAAGRGAVDTELFGVLDDDDEYTEDALVVRAAALAADPAADVVVTNGWWGAVGADEPFLPGIEAFERDPLGALTTINWLRSCSGLYRTGRFGADMFAAMPAYLEWTYLAIRIGLERSAAFLAHPTFRNHLAADSLSGSPACTRATPAALRRILALELPPRLRRHYRDAYLAALHSASLLELRERNRGAAWRCHLQSLGGWRGLRYLSHTRHLVAPGTA